METSGLPATLINLAAGTSLTGTGSFGRSTWTCSISTTANFYIMGSYDPCEQYTPTVIGPWLATSWPANSFQFGFGGNVRFDGTNWQTQSDGAHNGGFAVLGSTTGAISFYQIPDTGGLNQAITPTNFNLDLVGTIDANGYHAPAFIHNVANTAATGVVRLTSGDTACWRNNANSADLCIAKTAGDRSHLSRFDAWAQRKQQRHARGQRLLPDRSGLRLHHGGLYRRHLRHSGDHYLAGRVRRYQLQSFLPGSGRDHQLSHHGFGNHRLGHVDYRADDGSDGSRGILYHDSLYRHPQLR